MAEIRERHSNDKIKRKSGGHPVKDARRFLTSKYRKELVNRKNRDGDTPDAEATGQVEQTARVITEMVFDNVVQTIRRARIYRKAETGSRTKKEPKENISLPYQSIHHSIREHPWQSFIPKGKALGDNFWPKTQQNVVRTRVRPPHLRGASPVETARIGGNLFQERGRERVRRIAQQKLILRAQQLKIAVKEFSQKAITAAGKATVTAVGMATGLMGGMALVCVLCAVILVAGIMTSPFGILFSNEPTQGAVPLNVAISQINMELSDRLEEIQEGTYDGIDIQGQGPDWREVVAVFASKTAGAIDGVDVAELVPDRVERLRTVFWDMCSVSSEIESIPHGDSNPVDDVDDSWTEQILHITITSKTANDMQNEYGFTEYQNQALAELLTDMNTVGVLLEDLSASQATVRELARALPEDLSQERKEIVQIACSLVGKVNYFWGGKSLVLGWDSRWGMLRKVTAAGNSTSETYRPYGLDCSGFVDWVFYNASDGEYVIGHGGGASSQHTYCTEILWEDAEPGDLVFYPDDEHVGIIGGKNEDGELLIVHCASSANNVVITEASGFVSIARPNYYSE